MLHRNLLLPCNELPIETLPVNHQQKRTRNQRHRNRPDGSRARCNRNTLFATQSTSEDEDDALIFIPTPDLNMVPLARNPSQNSEDLSHEHVGDDSLIPATRMKLSTTLRENLLFGKYHQLRQHPNMQLR